MATTEIFLPRGHEIHSPAIICSLCSRWALLGQPLFPLSYLSFLPRLGSSPGYYTSVISPNMEAQNFTSKPEVHSQSPKHFYLFCIWKHLPSRLCSTFPEPRRHGQQEPSLFWTHRGPMSVVFKVGRLWKSFGVQESSENFAYKFQPFKYQFLWIFLNGLNIFI